MAGSKEHVALQWFTNLAPRNRDAARSLSELYVQESAMSGTMEQM